MEETIKPETKTYRVGRNIRQLREMKGISPKEMADKMDISVSGYTRIEREDVNLTSDRAKQIAEILGVSPGKLFDFDSEKMVFNQENKDHSIGIGYVNNYVPAEDLIKAKDETIASLKQQLNLYEQILKKEKLL